MPQISILIENKYHTETLDDPLLPQPAHQGGHGALHPHHQHLQRPDLVQHLQEDQPHQVRRRSPGE